MRSFFQMTFACFIVAALVALASAQTSTGTSREPTSQTSSSGSAARTNADEIFELSIDERHIIEQDFHASTSVEAGDERAQGVKLRVGVAVGASDIDVLLRNVHGRVRFRATLDPVLRRINARRAGSSAAP
jgi:hypothetical protein